LPRVILTRYDEPDSSSIGSGRTRGETVALSDFVTVQISLTKQPVSRQGFGTPLILAADCPAGFTQRVRTYNTPDALITDGFALTGPTYLLATVLMSQDQAPTSFKVGRLANKPTQVFTLVPTAQNLTEYAGTLNGARWTYTSDSSATTTEITTGIKAAIDALNTSQGRNLISSGTTSATYTQTNPGDFDSFSVENPDLLALTQTHADPGAAADLAAIAVEDSDFYGILNAFNSKLMAAAIATWAEAQGGLKEFFPDTCDSQHVTTVVGSATDLATTLKTAGDFYSSVWYSPAAGDFLAAAMCGLMLAQDAGSENWAMATPKVTAAKLTATHRANLVAKNCNFCESLGGQNNTFPGKVASGEWIDVVRFRAWLQVTMQADVLTALKAQSPKKTPYTDAGIGIAQAALQNVLNQGVKVGGLVNDPAPKVTVPKLSATSPTDRQNRVLTGVTWTAQLAEAINQVMPIKGQLTA
jgi:hypothetical protein